MSEVKSTLRAGVLMGLVAGCSLEQPADLGVRVSATVSGLWEGAALTLQLTAEPDGETLAVEDDGVVSFEALLDPGQTYQVDVAQAPAHHACTVENGVGQAGSSDITGIAVRCVGPSVSLSTSLPVAFEFDPEQLSYELEVSPIPQSAVLEISTDVEAEISVNGLPLGESTRSPEFDLPVRDTELMVEIAVETIARTYSLVIRRGQLAVSQAAYVKASNTGANDWFGANGAVAVDGDTLVVGAPHEDSQTRTINGPQGDDGRQDSGAAYVFRRSGGTWVQEAFLKASNADANDYFGASVAVDGDTLVVGARGEDGETGSMPDCGAAYVFTRAGTQWTQQAVLRPAACVELEGYGGSVTVSGDAIAVGCGSDGDSVFVFRQVGTGWQVEDQIPWPIGWGQHVRIDGDLLVVGGGGGAASGGRPTVQGSWRRLDRTASVLA